MQGRCSCAVLCSFRKCSCIGSSSICIVCIDDFRLYVEMHHPLNVNCMSVNIAPVGSTAVNGALYSRPALSEFDDWPEGWNRSIANEYYKRVENFSGRSIYG